MVILAVSPKKGLYKFNFRDKKEADIKVALISSEWGSGVPLQTYSVWSGFPLSLD